MPESERLVRLDELAKYEVWCQSHPPGLYMQYLRERSTELNALANPGDIGKGAAKRIHLTRSSLIELLTTMQHIGYGNENLAKFHIDIIVYRIAAIWKGTKRR